MGYDDDEDDFDAKMWMCFLFFLLLGAGILSINAFEHDRDYHRNVQTTQTSQPIEK